MEHPNRIAALSLALLGCLALSCIRLRTPYPEKSHYVLDVGRNAPKGEASSGVSLRVRAAGAAPLVQGQGLVWRESDVQWHEDFYHLFFAPPVSMVAEEARQWLDASGRFEWVGQSGTRAESTHAIEVGILELYGDLREEGSPRAVLSLVFTLTEETPRGPRIVFQGKYGESVGMENDTPDDLVRGWNDGLRLILGELEEELTARLQPIG